MQGGAKVVVEPHRHEGIFVARGKEDALVTLNSTPGVAVYGEKRISVDNPSTTPGGVSEKIEYRVWNPFRSKCESGRKSLESIREHTGSCILNRVDFLLVFDSQKWLLRYWEE